ncbi:RraA family protein [Jiangella muralis]|uniref:RraA family protein n=1 Tax=Jiangella muralis TaxID=702383 RepID=UPI00069F28E3|nr:RraA family protein [Jiangella muralis]
MSDAKFAGLTTATVSDALDRLGIPGALLGLKPLADGVRMCGPAFTVRYVRVGANPGTVGDYLDDVPPGAVVVLDNGGAEDCTVWGDILTAMAADRGVAGTVIDGVCRDVRRALDVGYPIFSRGRFMRTGKDRVEVADVNTAVTVGGERVEPGDWLLGDSDGVVAIRRDVADDVEAIAREIDQRESAIVDQVLSGRTLAAARSSQGYHELQRTRVTP